MSQFRIETFNGYDFFEVASAFQKSIRRGLLDDALYWGIELDKSNRAKYAWKRMKIICSEDIGVGEVDLPAQIRALYENWAEMVGTDKHFGERLFFVHAIVLLVKAKKSRLIDSALLYHYIENEPREMPDWVFDKHTRKGKQMGRGFEHFFTDACKIENEAGVIDEYTPLTRDLLVAGKLPGDYSKPKVTKEKPQGLFD